MAYAIKAIGAADTGNIDTVSRSKNHKIAAINAKSVSTSSVIVSVAITPEPLRQPWPFP
jgi:hypothetical protein